MVKLLLEHGADVNAQGGYHSNPLYAASYEGREQVVELLLEHGADANTQGGYYGNALQAALRKSHAQIAKLLLGKGAVAFNVRTEVLYSLTFGKGSVVTRRASEARALTRNNQFRLT
ncbi:ankyrin repeat domain containing protein [Paraphaeosphaeria sporulosa]